MSKYLSCFSNCRPLVRHGAPCVRTAAFKGCDVPLKEPKVVVGMGGAGVDYLASVATFPQPDQKLRTEALEVQGGGNCGNAMTAVSRLGCGARILSKIGDDALGDALLAEFKRDGVDVAHMLRAPDSPSPFTYIIVDRNGGTRTCIHTPGAPLQPSEMTPALCEALLDGAAMVYFDGRLTEASILLAKAARAAGVPVLVEAERLRPNLEMLMAEADYIVTSAHFPEDWTGEACVGDAMLAMALRLPELRFMITTMGKRGAVMLSMDGANGGSELREAELHATVEELFADAERRGRDAAAEDPDCVSARGVPVVCGATADSGGAVSLMFNREESAARDALQRALQSAADEASRNAAAGAGQAYAATSVMESEDGFTSPEDVRLAAQVHVCCAPQLDPEDVVDTTGAGDAFIGSVLYGLVTGLDRVKMLRLASVVAACKCTALGARPGLPHRENIAAELLS